jgi:hypothetical protein
MNLLLVRAYGLIGVKKSKVELKIDVSNVMDTTEDDDDVMDLQEDEIFELLDVKIEKTGNFSVKENLLEVARDLKISPMNYELTVFTKRFIDKTLKQWKVETMKKIKTSGSWAEHYLQFKDCDVLQKVAVKFSDKNHKILVNNYAHVNHDEESTMLDEILKFLEKFVAESEQEFWEALLKMLREAYEDFSDIVAKLKLVDLKLERFGSLLSAIVRENFSNEHYPKLKELANTILISKVPSLFENNAKVIAEYVKPLEIVESNSNGKRVFEIFGKNVRIVDVVGKIKDRMGKVDEIQFNAMDVLHVDADLPQEKFHGKNVFVLANRIKVHGKANWNVSGSNSNHQFSDNAGINWIGEGKDGEDGFAGESSGNIAMFTEKVHDAVNWKISANGGIGSKGQNGGNGRNGKDGEKFTEAKAKEEYRYLHREWFGENLKLYEKGSVIHYFRHHMIVEEARLVLVQGAEATVGKRGGWLGYGGEGGHQGELFIKIIGKETEAFEMKTESFQGKNGDDGKFGKSGKEGKRIFHLLLTILWAKGPFTKDVMLFFGCLPLNADFWP